MILANIWTLVNLWDQETNIGTLVNLLDQETNIGTLVNLWDQEASLCFLNLLNVTQYPDGGGVGRPVLKCGITSSVWTQCEVNWQPSGKIGKQEGKPGHWSQYQLLFDWLKFYFGTGVLGTCCKAWNVRIQSPNGKRSGLKIQELGHNSGFFVVLLCFGNPIPQSMVLPPVRILGMILWRARLKCTVYESSVRFVLLALWQYHGLQYWVPILMQYHQFSWIMT